MFGKGFYSAQEGHWINVLPPKDCDGGATGDRFHLKKYAHASILVQIGVSTANPSAITVKECDAATAGNTTAIGFDYYACETTSPNASSDVLATKATATTAGIAASGTNGIFYVIEIDAQQLTDGYPWIEVAIAGVSAGACYGSIAALLSGARYGNDASATAIA